MNSIIKEHGAIKKELRRYSNYQLCVHLQGVWFRIQNQTLEQIKNAVKKKQFWSDFVHKKWVAEHKLSAYYRVVEEISADRLQVQRKEGVPTYTPLFFRMIRIQHVIVTHFTKNSI